MHGTMFMNVIFCSFMIWDRFSILRQLTSGNPDIHWWSFLETEVP